jgi:hypothetical protein
MSSERLPSRPSTASRSTAKLTVATWNVHHRRSNAAIGADLDQVLATGVQVLGVNEVGGHEAAVGRARDNVAHFQARGERGTASSAVLWRTDVLRLVRAGTRRATRRVYVGPRGAGPATMPPKFVTWAQLRHLETSRNLFVLVSHFPATIEIDGRPNVVLRRRLKVNRAMWRANQWLASRFLPRGQVLVVGDLNWNARVDDGSYADAPKASASRMGLETCYEALGLPASGTKGDRLIDYVLFPNSRPDVIKATAQRIFDVNTDNDHRVLAVDLRLSARGAT